MSETTPPAKDASIEEIEADIAATRERLATSVDALADKANVKARLQASRPVQLAIVAMPIAVIVLLIVKAVRGRRS